nr:PREDICTED: transmembrane protein 244 [Latimeria chalumnae]|eukprot:XP_014353941.1 PREDICTED: transmembrane protein 244 [Latimeria chalumnae]
MAIKIKIAGIKAVLRNLLICLVIFYTVYYMAVSICFGAFRLEVFDILAPFDFKTEPSWKSPKYLVNLASMEVTYFVCGLLFACVVEEWVWDYALTVTIIHVLLATIVMDEFPYPLAWWTALGSGLISMICGGQLLGYYLYKNNFIYPNLDDF